MITDEAIEAAARAVEREIDMVEMVDTSASQLRKLRSKRCARAALQAAAPLLIAQAVKAEREACAQIAEDPDTAGAITAWETRRGIAAAIRARTP